MQEREKNNPFPTSMAHLGESKEERDERERDEDRLGSLAAAMRTHLGCADTDVFKLIGAFPHSLNISLSRKSPFDLSPKETKSVFAELSDLRDKLHASTVSASNLSYEAGSHWGLDMRPDGQIDSGNGWLRLTDILDAMRIRAEAACRYLEQQIAKNPPKPGRKNRWPEIRNLMRSIVFVYEQHTGEKFTDNHSNPDHLTSKFTTDVFRAYGLTVSTEHYLTLYFDEKKSREKIEANIAVIKSLAGIKP